MKVLVSVYSAIGFSSFGGFADDDSWAAEAGKLALALQKDQKSDFVQDFYYTAGYDSPSKLFNRTNEVWFVKTENTAERRSPALHR